MRQGVDCAAWVTATRRGAACRKAGRLDRSRGKHQRAMPLVSFNPTESRFQAVTRVVRDHSVVLQASHDDPRRYV
jgi:hypothetical protein